MANLKLIEKLRDDLKATRMGRHLKFYMPALISCPRGSDWEAFDGKPAVADLRQNGARCATAACLAGWNFIFNAPAHFRLGEFVDVWDWSAWHLGLTPEEYRHMFMGYWSKYGIPVKRITKTDAIRYLTKVVKEKNVMVKL